MRRKFSRFDCLFWLVCGLFTALGLVLAYAVVGYRFSALICFGIVVLLLCYRLLWRLSRKHRKAAKLLQGLLTVCVCIGLILATVTGVQIGIASIGNPETDCTYVVVLGAGVHGTTPSLSLQNRLDAAYQYLFAHPNAICVVSGGQGAGEDISEAQCMQNELTKRGIAPERIWMEDQAASTEENLAFSLELIESRTGSRPTQLGIVSSEYHLYRASLFAKAQEVEAVGIPATTDMLTLRINYFLREIAGVWHYMVFGG